MSAFGADDYPTNLDPVEVGEKLAQYVSDNRLDGVDLDYEDSYAMMNGKGADWAITLTRVLREKLPDTIIMHAPQAPYFSDGWALHGSYLKVDE